MATLRQTEYPHNTDEQVREYLQKALDVTRELDPADDLRPLVFAKAVELYSGKQIVSEQIAGIVPGLNAG